MSQRSERKILDQFIEELGKPMERESSRQVSDRVMDSLAALYEDGTVQMKALSVHTQTPRVARFPKLLPAVASTLLAAAVVLVGALSLPDANAVLAHRSNGSSVRMDEIVRTANKGTMLSLTDGTRVELGPMVELSLNRAGDGLRIDLKRGNVMVTAAKQHHGHLYVQTRDCLVTVVGTVFAVKAEESGSRVAVFEGKVNVEHGNVSQTLLPGEQVATNPEMAVTQIAQFQQQDAQTPPVVPLNDGEVKSPSEGAVIKNKTFFFRLWEQQANGNPPVLTDAARAGIFRYFTNWSTRSGAALIVQPILIDAKMLARYVPITDPGTAADSISSIVFTGIRGRSVSFANGKGDTWGYGCADCTFTVSENGVGGSYPDDAEGFSFKLNPDASNLTATCRSMQCSVATVRSTGPTGWQQPSAIQWDIKALTRGSEINIPVDEMLTLPVDVSTGPATAKQAYIFSFSK